MSYNELPKPRGQIILRWIYFTVFITILPILIILISKLNSTHPWLYSDLIFNGELYLISFTLLSSSFRDIINIMTDKRKEMDSALPFILTTNILCMIITLVCYSSYQNNKITQTMNLDNYYLISSFSLSLAIIVGCQATLAVNKSIQPIALKNESV